MHAIFCFFGSPRPTRGNVLFRLGVVLGLSVAVGAGVGSRLGRGWMASHPRPLRRLRRSRQAWSRCWWGIRAACRVRQFCVQCCAGGDAGPERWERESAAAGAAVLADWDCGARGHQRHRVRYGDPAGTALQPAHRRGLLWLLGFVCGAGSERRDQPAAAYRDTRCWTGSPSAMASMSARW